MKNPLKLLRNKINSAKTKRSNASRDLEEGAQVSREIEHSAARKRTDAVVVERQQKPLTDSTLPSPTHKKQPTGVSSHGNASLGIKILHPPEELMSDDAEFAVE
jgi:hypothetical protein